MIQWWQILLLTLYAGFQIMDELHWYSSAGSAVFSGFITGLIMGDMATGLFIGGSMQLTILGPWPPSSSTPTSSVVWPTPSGVTPATPTSRR